MNYYRLPLLLAACVAYLNLPDYGRHFGSQASLAQTPAVIAQDSSAFEGYLQAGEEAIQQQNYQTAIQKYQQALALRPDSTQAKEGLRNAQGYAYDSYMQQGYEATRRRDFTGAVENFQQAKTLRPNDYYAQQAIRNIERYQQQKPGGNSLVAILLGSAVILGVGALLWFFWRKKTIEPSVQEALEGKPIPLNSAQDKLLPASQEAPSEQQDDGPQNGAQDHIQIAKEPEPPPLQPTTRLPNLDAVEELIKDLKETSPKSRRKAIWELAQRGDSRAIRPLVTLMMETDSYERGLILTALSQICYRTLKPISQALAISLQDENPQVRKNAIRDSTKIYDLLVQVRQLLRHATNDPDPEVRETAFWALRQLEPEQNMAKIDSSSSPQNSTNHSDSSKETS